MSEITKKRLSKFAVRWFVGSLGLWIAATFLGSESVDYQDQIGVIIISGFLLALVNTIIRPIVVFMTLPAVLLTLGIFMVIINALMVLLVAWLYSPLEISGFGIAVITGLVIGLVNWLVSAILEDK